MRCSQRLRLPRPVRQTAPASVVAELGVETTKAGLAPGLRVLV